MHVYYANIKSSDDAVDTGMMHRQLPRYRPSSQKINESPARLPREQSLRRWRRFVL